MEKKCLHAYVTGLVQGVFYRRETCDEAKRKGLSGWVKNLPDGRVEVLILGERAAVEAMRDWLWQGPSRAKVTDVEVTEMQLEEMGPEKLNGFEVR